VAELRSCLLRLLQHCAFEACSCIRYPNVLTQGVGNFTINVPLSSENFYAGNETYALTAIVTSGYGVRFFSRIRADTFQVADRSLHAAQAQYSTVLNPKRINITVTV